MTSSIAIISDIHSNLEALLAVSKDIPNVPIYCLGDIVGYGANPKEVMKWMREKEVTVVMGNHDYYTSAGDSGWFNRDAADALKWTASQLNESEKKYLIKLPRTASITVDGFKIFMAHGSPSDPLHEYVHPETHEYKLGLFLKSLEVDVIALGHTHIPYKWTNGKGTVLNPGSVGQPRSGNPEACYVILTIELNDLRIEHRLVEYNNRAASDKIIRAGLPERFARRLIKGI